MGRFIGIRHRVKATAKGESRPTEVAIIDGENVTRYKLATETDELDWVRGRFPTEWREATDEDNLEDWPSHHQRVRRRKNKETIRVAESFDGLKPGDVVTMSLGGSGDNLAFALSRMGEMIGAEVLRIPPFALDKVRGDTDKDDDAVTLLEVGRNTPELCHAVDVRDRAMVLLRETFRARIDAMKDRIACEQRIRSRLIGQIFCDPKGLYPEGEIENEFDEEKANDMILQSLKTEERLRNLELKKALEALPVWEEIFEGIEGMGPAIASRIVASVGNIRRFSTKHKLKAYCGVHVMSDGRFPRKRHGEVANWKGEARQALYLLGDQMNRRPDSVWGQKFREYKVRLRAKHPEVEVVDGKKRYTDAHIHKMALWRTLTKFTEWLWREWTRLEDRLEAEERERDAEAA